MATARPQLITFAISHYCEKARWALDFHGLDYDEIGWPPGLHRILAKRAGARKGSVPMLMLGDDIIEGSDAIIDWAEAGSSGASLSPAGLADEIGETEKRLDKQIGVNVRRFIYAHVFPGQGHYVKPMLFANTSLPHRLAGNLMWPWCQKLIQKAYRLGDDAIAESRTILEAEFGWLEHRLASDRAYLNGTSFTRADLTAASLMAPFARPDEMPVYRDAELPQELMATIEGWSNRPVMNWTRDIYRKHRQR